MKVPHISLTVTWNEIPIMHRLRPRFTIQRLVIAVAIIGLFFAWVHQLEMDRVEQCRAFAARFAEMSLKNPANASVYIEASENASSQAQPWAAGWTDSFGSGLKSFGLIGLALWLVYLVTRSILMPHFRQAIRPVPR